MKKIIENIKNNLTPKANNSVMTLELYRYHGNWVFDDDNFGLVAEAFVSGMSEIIDKMIIEKFGEDLHEKGCVITISASGFPNSDAVIHRLKDENGEWVEEYGGNWYEYRQYDMQGWLCPALFHYFKSAPDCIYAKVDKN